MDARDPRWGRLAASAALSVLLSVWANAAGAAERVALVIGNGDYDHVASLANPRNDAEAVGDAFERLGYTVTRLMNADYDELRKGLSGFKQAARGKEVAVVFYAGHGIGVAGSNFLVPVDAELGYADAVEDEAIPLDRLMSAVGNTRHLGLVILDACRNNPFVAKMKGETRSIDRGLARVETTGKTMVAYAAKHGKTADDGSGAHSPYTEALLKYLKEPGLEVRKLFGKVHDAVVDTTKRRGRVQEPWTYEALGGRDFYLASAAVSPPKNTATSTAGGTPSLPSGDAARAYEAAERVGTVAAYRAFIRRFPRSFEAVLAQEQIDKLNAEAERKLKALKPRCPVESGQCWIELANKPSCHALVWWRETENQPAYKWWEGVCTGGFASGKGVLSLNRGTDGKDVRIGEGSYVDGKPYGQWTEYTSGWRAEGPYVDGKRHGEWKTIRRGRGRDGRGRKDREYYGGGPYVDGKKHGWWVDDRGRKIMQGHYVDGKRHGVWEEWEDWDGEQFTSCIGEEFRRGKRMGDFVDC